MKSVLNDPFEDEVTVDDKLDSSFRDAFGQRLFVYILILIHCLLIFLV